MDDRRPDEAQEYIEFTTQAVAVAQDADEAPRNLHISLDENAPEAGPPEAFEVSTRLFAEERLLMHNLLCSILSRMTHSTLVSCMFDFMDRFNILFPLSYPIRTATVRIHAVTGLTIHPSRRVRHHEKN